MFMAVLGMYMQTLPNHKMDFVNLENNRGLLVYITESKGNIYTVFNGICIVIAN